MDIVDNQLICHKIIVIEWLNPKDRKTGKDLYDDVLRHKTSNIIPIISEYYSVNSKNEFCSSLRDINNNCNNTEIITLDIETHGSEYGIGLNQDDALTWEELFALTRPLNIKCGGLLIITLSMCFGFSSIINVTPEDRAPFSVIIGAIREMWPDELYTCLSEFYKLYDSPLSLSSALNALDKCFINDGKETPFLRLSSVTWFDEFFKESRILEKAEIIAPHIAREDGIDIDCAKWHYIEDMREKRKDNRDYFNFFDTLCLTNVPLQYLK